MSREFAWRRVRVIGATDAKESAILVIPSQRPRPGVICTSANGADKVGIPWPGLIGCGINGEIRDGVRRTAEFAHVCRRS